MASERLENPGKKRSKRATRDDVGTSPEAAGLGWPSQEGREVMARL